MDSVKSIVVGFTLALLLAGCGSCGGDGPKRDVEIGPTGEDDQGLEVGSLTYNAYQILLTSGSRVKIGPKVDKPYFDVEGRVLGVNGGLVEVYEFSSTEDVESAIASISMTERKVGDKLIEGEEEIHFYRLGKVLILYLGSKDKVLEGLKVGLGEEVLR